MARARARAPSRLKPYVRKRDFARTPEPSGAAARRARPRGRGALYTIQKHDASRLHYDFRLELDGTLKSWAVPKGPSLDPADKRLAVEVEDHPLDYARFEGVIPEGEYGGGAVLLWDHGTWEPEGDPRAGYRKGHLAFSLHGEKLRGRWSLVRMHGRGRDPDSGERSQWLLIKGDDEYASRRLDIVRERPESVASGRRLASIAREEGGTPRQLAKASRADAGANGARADGRAKPAPKRRPPSRSRRAAGKPRGGSALPDFVPPELCTLVEAPPAGDDWLHEIKFDGFRMLARVEDGAATLWTRNRKEWTQRLPTLIAELERLPCATALLDGEVVVLDAQGVSNFEAFHAAVAHDERRTLYQVFDLLHLDGEDLRPLPLLERKRRLQALLARAKRPRVRFTDHVAGRGEAFYEQACRRGLEGTVAKRADAPYRSARGRDWLKIRCGKRQEFVIAGYTPSRTMPGRFGSLALAVHDADGRLRYAGRVGTGFGDEERRTLRERLDRLPRAEPPDGAPRTGELRQAVWVEPRLVGEVSYTEWTSAGRLRHPSFHGLREDKPATDVVRERPTPATAPAARAPARPASPRSSGDDPVVAGVRITHPDRVVWPDAGLTKLDLAHYYEQAAELLLEHGGGRPLALIRCPDGIGGQCFFQKHMPAGRRPPPGVKVVVVKPDGEDALTIASVEGLVGLVQNGVVELHLWGCHADDLERPDRLVLDLDPSGELPFARVIEAARDTRARLKDAGLETFVMTSGGKGLHVVAPLRRTRTFEEVKDFAQGVARAMEADDPRRYVAQASKARRTGRIFVDYLRNGRGATAVCPYAARARPGAPLAIPLRWDELRPGLTADRFRLAEAGPRLAAARRRDPWAGYRDAARQQLSPRPR